MYVNESEKHIFNLWANQIKKLYMANQAAVL